MKKYIKKIAVISFVLCGMTATAQEWTEKYDAVGRQKNGMIWVKKDNRYGYVDSLGNEILPCDYTAIGSYNSAGVVWVNKGGTLNNGSLRVKGGKYGVFDKHGKEIVPIKYKTIGTFSNVLSTDGNPYLLNSEIGTDILNETSKKQGKTKKTCWRESDNLNRLLFNEHVETGKDIVPSKQLAKLTAHAAGCMTLREPSPVDNRLFSELDFSTSPYITVLESTYEAQPVAAGGRKAYPDKESRGDSRWGIFTAKGDLVFKPGVATVYAPTDGFIPVANVLYSKAKRKRKARHNFTNIQYIDIASGETVATMNKNKESSYIAVSPVVDGHYAVFKEYNSDEDLNKNSIFFELYHIEKTENGLESKLVESYTAGFPIDSSDMMIVLRGGKYGIVNMAGEIIVPIEQIYLRSNGSLVETYDLATKKLGLIDQDGREVVSPQYDGILDIGPDGSYIVNLDKKFGKIDQSGRVILPVEFENVIKSSETDATIHFAAKKKGHYQAYRAYENHPMFETDFSAVRNFGHDYDSVAIVWQKDKKGDSELAGVVNTSGEMLVPCICSKADVAKKIYDARVKDGFTHWTLADHERFIACRKAESSLHIIKQEGKNNNKSWNLTIPSEEWDY